MLVKYNETCIISFEYKAYTQLYRCIANVFVMYSFAFVVFDIQPSKTKSISVQIENFFDKHR